MVVVAGAVLLIMRSADERWKALLVICWLVIPVAVTAAVSTLHPLFLDRYLIVVLPAASICVASLLCRAPGWFGVAAVAVTCAWVLGPLVQWYRSPYWEDWRSAAAYVDTRRARGDHLVVTPDWLVPVAGYYLTTRPDARDLDGAVIWVMTAADRQDSTEQEIRSRGYVVVHQQLFPGVFVAKAVKE